MFAEPQEEHRWLQRLEGNWTYEAECAAGSGQIQKHGGVQRIRKLGELWIVGEAQGQMPGGGSATMMITLGYDPQKGSFVGSWVGSMMNFHWIYEGRLDAAKRVLALECDGPSFSEEGRATGRTSRYRDAIEIHDNDYHTLTASVRGEDGSWTSFMTSHYRREA